MFLYFILSSPLSLPSSQLVIPSQFVSWCRVECGTDGLTSVTVATEQITPPPLTIMSLSMKTLLNSRNRTNEVRLINYSLHMTTPTKLDTVHRNPDTQ